MEHGSRFAQTVLRNASQVQRLRQDKLHRMDRIWIFHHSSLEGESARQGRQPAVAPVGGGRQPFIHNS